MCLCVCPSETQTCCIIACKHSFNRLLFGPAERFFSSLDWMKVEQPMKCQTAPGQVWRPAINPWTFFVRVCVFICMCVWLRVLTFQCPPRIAGVRVPLWLCVCVCVCVPYAETAWHRTYYKYTHSSSFLQASSALLLPFHSWKEHKNDRVSRIFFELIYRLCFPARLLYMDQYNLCIV